MSEVWFYHLETTPLEQTLPELLEKAAARGWRSYVHCTDADRRQVLDELLWTYRPDSFLAHAQEGTDMATDQPVLIGESAQPANDAQMFVSVSPADLPSLEGFQRVLIVFEEANPQHLGWAREQWKRLKSDTIALSYWKQTPQGRWEKKS